MKFNIHTAEPPVWREWSPWSECSTSCGPGSRSRSRTCNQNQQCPNGEFCEDDGEETEGCEVNPESMFITVSNHSTNL